MDARYINYICIGRCLSFFFFYICIIPISQTGPILITDVHFHLVAVLSFSRGQRVGHVTIVLMQCRIVEVFN